MHSIDDIDPLDFDTDSMAFDYQDPITGGNIRMDFQYCDACGEPITQTQYQTGNELSLCQHCHPLK